MATNKVVYGSTTVMDITDTTATPADVADGVDFYGNDGVKRTGTANYMAKVSNPTADNILTTDANGQAQDSGVSIDDVREVFIAKVNTTTAAELKAAYSANKIILIIPAGTYTNYGYIVTNFNNATSTRCQLACLALNGMTLSNGLTMFLWDVEGAAWTLRTQTLQNRLESGQNIKTINGESILGSGNLTIEGESYTPGDGIDITNSVISGTKMDATKGATNSVEVTATNGTSIGVDIGDDIILTALSPGLFTEQKTLQEKLSAATETTYGIVKLNPSENVTLNAAGQLDVGGRLGQMANTTGIYAPKSITPAAVGDGAFLITDGSGTSLGPKSLGVTTGTNITCKSAAAGSTVYRVSNTYENRIKCAMLRIPGAVIALSEAEAKKGYYANVVSVRINGADFTPSSAADDPNNDIVITAAATINPDAATTTVRMYPASLNFSTVHAGQGAASNNGNGASVIVGQAVTSAGGNANNIVGASIYNQGNGNTVVGRQHISRKNRWFLAGTGHDNSNGRSEVGTALGSWSDITSDTAFVIGNGTGHRARSNLFEIKTNGDVYINGTKVLP